MIEKYSGHVTPAKNADCILQGIRNGAGCSGSGHAPDSVNAGVAGANRNPYPKMRSDLPDYRFSAEIGAAVSSSSEP
jgi:hypothetical protein